MPAAVTYTTVLGQVLMENRGGIVTEFVPDPLGSVVKHKDSSGAYVHSAEYWPYGEIQTSTGNNPNSFAFCGTWGYYRDNASQTYVRARYYKPVQGRWMTVDPLWPINTPFEYADNQPNHYLDYHGTQVSRGKPKVRPKPKPKPKPRSLPPRWPTSGDCKPPLWDIGVCTVFGKVAGSRCVICLYGLRSELNQIQDEAVRHCIGACLAVRECGCLCAKGLDAREAWGSHRNGMEDSACDVVNNGIGRGLAEKYPTGDCANMCLDRKQWNSLCEV